MKSRLDDFSVKEIWLDIQEFHNSVTIERSLVDKITATTYRDLLGNAVVDLCLKVAGKAETVETIKYPNTWLDAFKDRWAPSWLRSRLNINYTIIDVTKHTLFPSIEIPKHPHMVTVFTTKRESGFRKKD